MALEIRMHFRGQPAFDEIRQERDEIGAAAVGQWWNRERLKLEGTSAFELQHSAF